MLARALHRVAVARRSTYGGSWLKVEEQLGKTQAVVDELQRPTRWRHMAPAELLKEANDSFRAAGHALQTGRYNGVVVGPTGAGKSSLLRGILASNAARAGLPIPRKLPHVSAVQEGSLILSAWEVPGSKITLWDCPGGNTLTADTRAYVAQQHLAVFQMQVVVVERRFEALHANLLFAHKTKFPGQRLVVVFPKGNQLLSDMRHTNPGLSTTDAITRIKAETVAAAGRLVEGGYPLSHDSIFVLSAHALEDGGAKGTQAALALGVLEEERFLLALEMMVAADAMGM